MNHNIEDLERGINHCEHAIKISPGSSTLANNLASDLTLRCARKGDPQSIIYKQPSATVTRAYIGSPP